ncbi:MAG: riboflavin synthase [Chloroflexi bacterium]|nr:riboflavin synthase [Chloroflexota bacterium]
MFTGIIEEIGTVQAVRKDVLVFGARKVLEGTRIGDSIAVNGVCLTVTFMDGESFTVGVMPETLRRSNLGQLKVSDAVNLERALGAGERMGGHFVQGHVEGVGHVLSVVPEENALVVRISAPPELMRYIVPKGFVAVDGVSLTVVECDERSFTVSLVPYTQENIALPQKGVGMVVNLETDIIAKYVERFLATRQPKLTMEFLAEHGFLEK